MKVTAPPQSSLAGGVPRLTLEAGHEPASPLTVTLDGQKVMVGGVLSTNVMCWMHVEVWPPLLTANHVRSMPVCPAQFAGVLVSVKVIPAGPPRQLPVAGATPVLFVSVDSPHCNCLSPGHVMSGAPVLATVTVCWQVLTQPLVPVTVRLRLNEPLVVE